MTGRQRLDGMDAGHAHGILLWLLYRCHPRDTAFKTDRWTLILLNHQTGADILALIKVFYRKISI